MMSPMLSRIKLSQKGLLIVSVPLLFELILVTVLLFILCPLQNSLETMSRDYSIGIALRQIMNDFTLLEHHICLPSGGISKSVSQINEEQARWHGRGRARIEAMDRRESRDRATRFPNHMMQVDWQEYTKWFDSASGHIKDYENLARFDSSQSKYGDHYQKGLTQFASQVDQAKRNLSAGRSDDAILFTTQAHNTIRTLNHMAALHTYSHKSKQEELRNSINGIDEHKLEAAADQVRLVLIVGSIVNLGLAAFLAILFSKTASARLLFLMDNTRRLAEGRALNPTLEGSDELALLDGSFHSMAARLESSRLKEQAIIRNASDIMCSFDSRWTFCDANPASNKIWRMDPETLKGMSLEAVLSPNDWRSTNESLTRIREMNEPMSFENEVVLPQGLKVPMLWSARWNEEQGRMFCVARDITERKQLEKMKQDFVDMVSTQLRKPLSHLDRFLSALTASAFGQLNKEGGELSKKSLRNNKRLLELVNDLLNLDKLSTGQIDLKLADESTVDLCQRSIDAVQGFASKMQIKILNKSDDLTIECDGDRVVQVLVNLIGNAVKFSPKGSEIICWCSSSPDAESSNKYLKFSVQDFGRGIPEAMCKSVFEKFKQVSKADATEKGGSGLGLAICKTIIESHGGEIGVDSELGKGSVFWFKIPKKGPAQS